MKRKGFVLLQYIVCFFLLIFLTGGITEEEEFDWGIHEDTESMTVLGEVVDGMRIEQTIPSKGSGITAIGLLMATYNDRENEGTLDIEVYDQNELVLKTEVSVQDIQDNSYYYIDLGNKGGKANYKISVCGVGGTSGKAVTFWTSLNSDMEKYGGKLIVNDTEMHSQIKTIIVYKKVVWGRLIFVLALSLLIVSLLNSFISLLKSNQPKSIKWEKATGIKEFFLGSYLGIAIIPLVYPLIQKYVNVTSFDRTFGKGFINNWDCGKLVNNYYLFFFVIALAIILGNLFIAVGFGNIDKKSNLMWKYLDILLPIAWVSLLLNYRADDGNYYYSIMPVFINITLVYSLYMSKIDLPDKADYKCVKSLNIVFLILAFIVGVISRDLSTWIYTYLLLHIILLIIVLKYKKIFFSIVRYIGKQEFLAYIAPIFLLTSIFIETLNILNQHNIIFKNDIIIYCLFIFISLAIWILLVHRKKLFGKKIPYALLIMGLSGLAVNIGLINIKSADIFESANSAILISNFLNYGKIPIIENYGGHMLSDVIGGIIYAVLNNDVSGAIFTPYSVYLYMVIYGLTFLILKEIFDEELTFWILLFIPVYGLISYWGIGFLVCLCAIRLIRKNTFMDSILFWISCVFTVLYRLDLGVAFGGAATVALILIFLKEKEKSRWKNFIFSFATISVSALIVFALLCLFKKIDILTRLKEFIQISASNTNWAYDSVGDVQSFAFYWYYIIVPIFLVISLIYLWMNKRILHRISKEQLVILLILAGAYFLNFSRGCVRHSLVEGINPVFIFDVYIYLAIYFSVVVNKRSMLIWAMAGGVILFSFVGKSEIVMESNLLSKTESNVAVRLDEMCKGEIAEKQSRILWSDGLKDYILPLENVINVLLDEDETWVDFCNITFAYAAMGRECPVYVAQSPGILSGEFTQNQFIEQIEKASCPIALLPGRSAIGLQVALDSIQNNYRYYEVAEYLYQNYEPLCEVNDIALWCHKGYKENYLKILNNRLSTEETKLYLPIEYGYDNESWNEFHFYDIELLPYFWAKYENPDYKKLTSFSNNELNNGLWISNEKLDVKGKSYVSFKAEPISSDIGSDFSVYMGHYNGNEFIEKYGYKLEVMEGKNQYLIRVSCDYNWFLGNINAIRFEGDTGIAISDVKVVMEDGTGRQVQRK